MIEQALRKWWDQSLGPPKITLVMKNDPAIGGGVTSHVEWPRLMVCLKGVRDYESGVEGQAHYRIETGQALYFAPGTWISPLPVGDFSSLGIHWEPDRIRLILREHNPFDSPVAVWSIPRSPRTERRLAEKVADYMSRVSGRCAAEGLLLLEVGDLLDRLRTDSQPPVRPQLYLYLKMGAYLEEHYRNAHSRESVASRFGISTGHLTRIFREEGGTGFSRFLCEIRLREAERLLRSTALSVQEIALQCGFTDAGYFSRLFRHRYGRPPSSRK